MHFRIKFFIIYNHKGGFQWPTFLSPPPAPLLQDPTFEQPAYSLGATCLSILGAHGDLAVSSTKRILVKYQGNLLLLYS